MLCVRCGNEFYKRHIINKEGKELIQCPFCGQYIMHIYKKKRKVNCNE